MIAKIASGEILIFGQGLEGDFCHLPCVLLNSPFLVISMKTTSFLQKMSYDSQAEFTCRACVRRGAHQEQVGDDGVLEGDVRDSVNGRDGAGLDTVQIIQYLPPTQLKLSDFNQKFQRHEITFL